MSIGETESEQAGNGFRRIREGGNQHNNELTWINGNTIIVGGDITSVDTRRQIVGGVGRQGQVEGTRTIHHGTLKGPGR
jgi:hypothetical protein